MAGHMTGLNVRTLIPEKRLAGEILAVIITPVLLVRTLGRAVAGKVTLVSSLMEFSSAGCIPLGIVRNLVKMARLVAARFVFSRIHQISFGFCLRRAPDPGRVIWKSGRL